MEHIDLSARVSRVRGTGSGAVHGLVQVLSDSVQALLLARVDPGSNGSNRLAPRLEAVGDLQVRLWDAEGLAG
jgi:hypothetical protein